MHYRKRTQRPTLDDTPIPSFGGLVEKRPGSHEPTARHGVSQLHLQLPLAPRKLLRTQLWNKQREPPEAHRSELRTASPSPWGRKSYRWDLKVLAETENKPQNLSLGLNLLAWGERLFGETFQNE